MAIYLVPRKLLAEVTIFSVDFTSLCWPALTGSNPHHWPVGSGRIAIFCTAEGFPSRFHRALPTSPGHELVYIERKSYYIAGARRGLCSQPAH